MPTVCELERTPTECHLKRDLERSFRPKAHHKRSEKKSPPPLKQLSKPHTYHKHCIHIHPQTSTQQRQTQWNNQSGGAHHEHLNSKHRAFTPAPTPNHQDPRGSAASKQSSRMSRCASTKRMSACASCKSTWPGERRWRKDHKSCSNRLNRKEQPK
jgi:hypothetical protein